MLSRASCAATGEALVCQVPGLYQLVREGLVGAGVLLMSVVVELFCSGVVVAVLSAFS